MQNRENKENTLKINVFKKSILFCKYLRNQSSDVHEFYVEVNYYLVTLNFKFHEDPCTNARAPVINARVHVLSRVRAFTTRARAFMHGSS